MKFLLSNLLKITYFISDLLSDEIKFFICEKAYQDETYETIVELFKNRWRTISKRTITKITNKYDEHCTSEKLKEKS